MTVLARTDNSPRASGALQVPSQEPERFHRQLPGYAPTPLVDAAGLADELGVGRLYVKDESSRFGLPSFKIMGASWAVVRALEERLGEPLPAGADLDGIARALAPLGRLTLVAATDGNHGRAVARMARLLGYASHILVPEGMAPARIDAIRSEGATVTRVAGTYDEAIERSAAEAADDRLVISDTSWDGYEQVPAWIMDGYSTIFWEVEDQLAATGAPPPDVVLVQIGVGAFATALVRHYRRSGAPSEPLIVGIEPEGADCVRASIAAGRRVDRPGPHRSIMSGLNAGTPSQLALPELSRGIDLFLTVADGGIVGATQALHRAGVEAGETGAAGVACLKAMRDDPALTGRIPPDANVLTIVTEGATDPDAYRRILGQRVGADWYAAAPVA